MTDYRMMVFANAQPGQDAPFNAWYDKEHLGRVLQIPGFVSGARYRVAEHQRKAVHPSFIWKYMTDYALRTDDLPATLKALTQKREGEFSFPYIDLDATTAVVFEPVSAPQFRL